MFTFLRNLFAPQPKYYNYYVNSYNGYQFAQLKIPASNFKGKNELEVFKTELEYLLGEFEDGNHTIDGWGRDLYYFKHKSSQQIYVVSNSLR